MRTILLVDDEPKMHAALCRTLHRDGYQILTADSAAGAARVVETRAVDLVVCDQMMPGTTGTEFLAWLAGRHPGIVRILLTGCPTAATALSAINEGKIYHFFTKPCDPLDLAITIRHALEQKSLVENTQRLLDEMEVALRNGLDLLEAARLLLLARNDGSQPPGAPQSARERPAEEAEEERAEIAEGSKS